MKHSQQLKFFYYFGFILVFLIVWAALHYGFSDLKAAYKGMISAGVAAIFAPQFSEYDSQSGRKVQVRWLFFKKIITL